MYIKGMFIIVCILSAINFQDQEIPLLPKESFTYKMDYFLKEKPDNPTEVYNVQGKKDHGVMLAYVKIHFKLVQLEETDRRVRLIRSGQMVRSRKVRHPMELTLDMGFAVDMKDGLSPSHYIIYVDDQNKEPRARIDVEVREDGRLMINDEFAGIL